MTSSYVVLLQVGFTYATRVTTCAVGSYPTISPLPLHCIGGFFSVALSSRLPSPGVTRHFALWSPDFPLSKRTWKAVATATRTAP